MMKRWERWWPRPWEAEAEWDDSWGPDPLSDDCMYEEEPDPSTLKSPAPDQDEVDLMLELEEAVEACRKARAELATHGRKLYRITGETAGLLYEPVHKNLLYFRTAMEELEELEHALLETVKGRVVVEGENDRVTEIQTAMERCLNEREQKVFCEWYYPENVGIGFWGVTDIPQGAKTQAEIGRELGISQSRVSQILKTACEKMIAEVGWLA